jgi:hypothetical protein
MSVLNLCICVRLQDLYISAVSHLFPSGSFSKGLLLQIFVYIIVYTVSVFLKQLWLGTVTNEKLPGRRIGSRSQCSGSGPSEKGILGVGSII